jgi:hypothetical protein
MTIESFCKESVGFAHKLPEIIKMKTHKNLDSIII